VFRDTLGQDWMVFDTAARAYLHGNGALLLDGVRLTQVLNDTHPTLRQRIIFHPWVYPPFALLLALPFGMMPWAFSYYGFQALSFAGMAAALRPWAADWRQYALILAGVTLCPATAYTLGSGQNSFLSAALLLGGAWYMGARPFLAGVLFGLLAFKPQLGLLIPVALVAASAWRAFAGATVTVLVLFLVSLVVPGLEIWRGFLHLYLGGDQAPRQWVELYGQSVFTYLNLAGAGAGAANAGQGLALLIGAACTWCAFRRPYSFQRRLLVLLYAISFASPHFGDYDAVLMGVGAMLLLVRGEPGFGGMWVAALACLTWCSTAINPPYLFLKTLPALFPPAELTPVFVLALLIYLAFARPREAVVPAAA
jgi:hypothetical protein